MAIAIHHSPFSKHLHNLIINGFYCRDMEADDFEFIEYVRKCGIANGSLPNTDVVLLEELEFWHLPYSLAPAIERRVGRQRRLHQQIPSPSQEKRQALDIIRQNEKAIADAELARERQEWEKARRQRAIRRSQEDFEWEAAAPRTAKFGATINRHYVPQWRLDENKPPESVLPPQPPPSAPSLTPQEQEEDRLRREKIIAQARIDLAVAETRELERQHELKMRDIRHSIVALIDNSYTGIRRNTLIEIMTARGCDASDVETCLNELIQSGEIKDDGRP